MEGKTSIMGVLIAISVATAGGLGYLGYEHYSSNSQVQDGGNELINAYDHKVASLVTENDSASSSDEWDGSNSNQDTQKGLEKVETNEKEKNVERVLDLSKKGESEEDSTRDDDGTKKKNDSQSQNGNATDDANTQADSNGIIHNEDGSETWDKDAEYDKQIENFSDDDIKNADADLGELAKVVVGHIKSKKINLNLPLFEGISEEKMSYGGGTLKPGQEVNKNGNFAVGGHNLHTVQNVLFSQVPRLKAGDIVEIDFHGKDATYEITSITIISPYDTAKIKDSEIENSSNKRLLSIITCTNDAKNRYLVRGKQISVSK